MEELIKKAQELGIDDAETLTKKQLEKAIATAEKGLAPENDTPETEAANPEAGAGAEQEATAEKELNPEAEAAAGREQEAVEPYLLARQAEIVSVLSKYLGVEDIDELTPEMVEEFLEKAKNNPDLTQMEVVQPTVVKGKTDKSCTVNGKEYVFAEGAPAAFRYLGQFRTQEEWIEDSDSIELMVAGKLAFLTLKK